MWQQVRAGYEKSCMISAVVGHQFLLKWHARTLHVDAPKHSVWRGGEGHAATDRLELEVPALLSYACSPLQCC
jgi:hypothetical protein